MESVVRNLYEPSLNSLNSALTLAVKGFQKEYSRIRLWKQGTLSGNNTNYLRGINILNSENVCKIKLRILRELQHLNIT